MLTFTRPLLPHLALPFQQQPLSKLPEMVYRTIAWLAGGEGPTSSLWREDGPKRCLSVHVLRVCVCG
jgi:hypothetical protein